MSPVTVAAPADADPRFEDTLLQMELEIARRADRLVQEEHARPTDSYWSRAEAELFGQPFLSAAG